MKFNKYFSATIFIVGLAFSNSIFAQSNFYPGYVIMLKGDTLYGEIKKNPKNEFDNFSKASFRKKNSTELKSFNPTKIKEYLVDGVSFVSKNIDGEQVFVKCLSKGSANLFELQFEVMQMNEISIKSDYYMEKKKGDFVKIKSGKFKKQIVEAMEDNPVIVKAVEDNTYEYKNIVELFNAYNKKDTIN